MRRTSHRRGVTLIELILVIGLLLILAALLLPAVGKVREAASRTQSSNNLKQIGISIHAFHDTNKRFPPMAGKVNGVAGSVLFHVLPYLEQANTYKEAKGDSWSISGTVIPVLVDPRDQSAPGSRFENTVATTSYAGNWLMFDGKYQIFNIPDGTSNTIMSATRYQICNGTPTAWAYSDLSPWSPMIGYYSLAKFQASPSQKECDPQLAQAINSLMLVGLGDGSVRFVAPELSPLTWWCAMRPDDGMPLGADW